MIGDDRLSDMHDLGVTLLSSLTEDRDFVKLNPEDQKKKLRSQLLKLEYTNKEAHNIISKLVSYNSNPRYDTTSLLLFYSNPFVNRVRILL